MNVFWGTATKASRVTRSNGFGFWLAGFSATLAIIGTTSTISFQDIAELTGTKTGEKNRWLAHMVSIPKGSDHAKVSNRLAAYSTGKVKHVSGVNVAGAVRVLDKDHKLHTGIAPSIERSLKGDRVYIAKKKAFNVASAANKLLNSGTLVTGPSTKSVNKSQQLIANAQAFHKVASLKVEPPKGHVEKIDRPAAKAGQLNQARAAARKMSGLLKQASKPEVKVAANPTLSSVVSSYAPVETNVASAFAAVLRPSLKKPNVPKPEATIIVPTTPSKRPVRKKTSKKRSLVVLGPGDHKWAAKSLPRLAYSRNERRCLASGVYFEARSESKAGQQAVAQVILNRVKNPAYPGTICGVVYQNKWKRNACQFSFACDGIRDRVKSRKHWRKAVKVANAAIEGRTWLKSVGSASHYHADYVWPRWRRKMRKMTKIGRHIFYRTYGGGWS